MYITNYINKENKILTLDDSIEKAQLTCKDYPVSHIPIIEDKKLIGCFAENDIRTIENSTAKISEHKTLLQYFFVDEKATILELISIFANNNSNLIPVLGKENNYIGNYDLADILDAFADSPFLHRDSETLVVEKVNKDFSMSQVAQIIESNGGKLLGSYLSNETIDNVQITLKIKTSVMNEIIQTFRRYDYNVITQHIDDKYLEELKDRANYFKRYLEI